MFFQSSVLDIFQNAIPNIIPPIGFIKVKIMIRISDSKIGSDENRCQDWTENILREMTNKK